MTEKENKTPWFEIDKEGLKELYADKPPEKMVMELIQNALDEEITECTVDLTQDHRNPKHAILMVTDDSPVGFRDLKHAFTLFGHTYKRERVDKRGRFNLGEKLILSISIAGSITTTTGQVVFNRDGTKTIKEHIKLNKGSVIRLILPWNKDMVEDINSKLDFLFVPKKVKLVINNRIIEPREPDFVTNNILETEVFKNGAMRQTWRKTQINIYKSREGEEPHIFEMGLPICEVGHGCPYHIDVQQRVPLSKDRDSVKQAFLLELCGFVLNTVVDDLGKDEVSEDWVRMGVARKNASDEQTVQKVIKKRYGNQVAIGSYNVPHSIDEALDKGVTVVAGQSLGHGELSRFKEVGVETTSQMFSIGTETKPATIIPENQWTPAQKRIVGMTKMLAQELPSLGFDVLVKIVKLPGGSAAWYVPKLRELCYNASKLGKNFFELGIHPITLGIALHELAHEEGFRAHVNYDYVNFLQQISGEAVMMALMRPELFSKFNGGEK